MAALRRPNFMDGFSRAMTKLEGKYGTSDLGLARVCHKTAKVL